MAVQANGAGLRHYNLSISTSDQMIAHKFRGKLDRSKIIEGGREERVGARGPGRPEAREYDRGQRGGRVPDRRRVPAGVRAGGQGGRGVAGPVLRHHRRRLPGRIRERFAKLASAIGIPVETHCHNDLGMAVANSVSGALGDLDAGQDAWINTCVNGIGERAGNADLLSCILAFRYGFGIGESATIGDPVDLSWARRFGLWAAYAFGQPLPPAWPGVGRNAFAHESGIHADGALKDRATTSSTTTTELGPFPADWFTRQGRVVLTGEYGGKAGFRHVLDGLGSRSPRARRTWRSRWSSCARPPRQAADRRRAGLIAGTRGNWRCSSRAAHPPPALFLVRSLLVQGRSGRGRTGLLATVGPVAVGVMLAFG